MVPNPADSFDVYLRGSLDVTPPGLRRLVEQIEREFGVLAGALGKRLESGPVRVKQAVPRALAQKYADKLKKFGGVAVVVAHGQQPLPERFDSITSALAQGLVRPDGKVPTASVAEEGAPDFAEEALELADTSLPTPLPQTHTAQVTRTDTPLPDLPFEVPSAARMRPPSLAPDLAPEVLSPQRIPVGVRGVVHRRSASVRLLAVAFVLGLFGGFVPAAWYMRDVQQEEIKPLREREAALRRSSVTSGDPTLVEEQRLRIRAIKFRSGCVTFGLWVVVGGLVGACVFWGLRGGERRGVDSDE